MLEVVRQHTDGLLAQRELLIEHLHRLQDALGALPRPILVALAKHLSLPMAAVYEVATFYHHFDVLDDGVDTVEDLATLKDTITVRVCDSVSCHLNRAGELLRELQNHRWRNSGKKIRVKPAPCVGRCAGAPVVVVDQLPVEGAKAKEVINLIESGSAPSTSEAAAAKVLQQAADYDAYRADGGYHIYAECIRGERDVEAVIDTLTQSGLRGLGGAGFLAGRKWSIVRSQSRQKNRRGEYRRGRAGDLQRPVLLGTRSASIYRRRADRRLGGGRGRYLYLPAR